MTKFHCLIDVTSQDIGQYVYYSCLLTRRDVIKFEINFIFLIRLFWCMIKKSRQKLNYLENTEWNLHYSFLNVKELLAQNRHNISSLSDSNAIRTHNHLVYGWTLKHLAKLALFYFFVCFFGQFNKMVEWSLWTKWLWVQILLL